MYVWFVRVFMDDNGHHRMIDQSEPFISPEKAMKWYDLYDSRQLKWNHIETTKFDGTVLEHWQASFGDLEYLLDKEYVIGSDD